MKTSREAMEKFVSCIKEICDAGYSFQGIDVAKVRIVPDNEAGPQKIPTKPNPQSPVAARAEYTGDICKHCDSSRVVRSGTCALCHDCGETTGCS